MKLKTIVISGANDYTPTVLQGYVGGISMENVLNELDKINQVVPEDREIFIDAEGKLKGEDVTSLLVLPENIYAELLVGIKNTMAKKLENSNLKSLIGK